MGAHRQMGRRGAHGSDAAGRHSVGSGESCVGVDFEGREEEEEREEGATSLGRAKGDTEMRGSASRWKSAFIRGCGGFHSGGTRWWRGTTQIGSLCGTLRGQDSAFDECPSVWQRLAWYRPGGSPPTACRAAPLRGMTGLGPVRMQLLDAGSQTTTSPERSTPPPAMQERSGGTCS